MPAEGEFSGGTIEEFERRCHNFCHNFISRHTTTRIFQRRFVFLFQVLYAKQSQFCTSELERLNKEITDDRDDKERSEGDMSDAQADQASLSK